MPNINRVSGPGDGSPHVLIATPSYGPVLPNYTVSLAKTMLALPKWGVRVDLCLLEGDCHVDDSRNTCVNEFMRSSAEQMVFIDNDVGWEPESLMRLINHDRDMVAGVYPLKQQIEGYPVLPFPNTALYADADGLVEVKGVPTGFLKLTRSMLTTMLEKYGHRYYWAGHQEKTDEPLRILFERTYEDSVRYSGDYAFCRKWREIGGKIYVDPELLLSHHGAFEWSGTLGDHWKRVHGIKAAENEKKMEGAIETLRAGRLDPQTLSDLSEGWGNRAAASTELLAACWHLARETNGPIVECGSGLTTIVMAAANPKAKICALECEPVWVTKLNEALRGHGLDNTDLRYSPIHTYPEGRWYGRLGLPKPALALIDGPWRAHGRRDLAYEFLDLSDATVIVDDVADPKEGEPAKAWAAREGRQMHVMGGGRFAVIPK